MTATVTLACPECEAALEGEYQPGAPLTCRSCGHTQEFHERALRGGQLVACPACGLKVLYRQKDFRQAIGCLVVAIAAILAPSTYYLSLVVAALIDALLYYLAGTVVICYGFRCRAHMRGFEPGPGVKPFDLSIHDYYRGLARESDPAKS